MFTRISGAAKNRALMSQNVTKFQRTLGVSEGRFVKNGQGKHTFYLTILSYRVKCGRSIYVCNGIALDQSHFWLYD